MYRKGDSTPPLSWMDGPHPLLVAYYLAIVLKTMDL